jgi:hypothetical protein
MMTTLDTELRDALQRFMAATGTRDSEQISTALTAVCDLEQRLDASAHPMLRHYLERRSYQKALDFLNTGAAATQAPQCHN